MGLRVVGAGLGRTGTMSLKLALEQLLGGRCYHMFETFARPDDGPVWVRASNGEMPDWNAFLTEYNAAVRATARPDRLLEYRSGSGWEPLCTALGVPVPDAPFPHTNTAEEFRQRLEETTET